MSDSDLEQDVISDRTSEPLIQGSSSLKIPPAAPFIIAVIMFGASFWAGGRIAESEVAMIKLDDRTAQGHIVKVKADVAPGAVIAPEAIEELPAYANRIEPYFINSAAATQGKKAKFGLEVGQVITVKDLD
ncbi:MAG: hypothetical protein KGS72_01765 [Cyanobacteria bacterium REEB67]|nr:hypothetical protein [Cyanobacteria bacterium REEB67]